MQERLRNALPGAEVRGGEDHSACGADEQSQRGFVDGERIERTLRIERSDRVAEVPSENAGATFAIAVAVSRRRATKATRPVNLPTARRSRCGSGTRSTSTVRTSQA